MDKSSSHDYRLVFFLFGVLAILGPATGESFAQNCDNFLSIHPEYLPDCRLRVNVQVLPFNRCGAPLPGNLQIRIYKDTPSSGVPCSSGGLVITTGCEWRAEWGTWRPTFSLPASWNGAENVFVEAWVDPGGSGCPYRCSNWAPIRVDYHPTTLDSDGDGARDCVDGCPVDPDKTEAGLCGCNVPDDDSDSDGVVDCLDGCPTDPAKADPGICGCGMPDSDSDADGVADCLDGCEGSDDALDCNGDGTPDACDDALVADIDSDGIVGLSDYAEIRACFGGPLAGNGPVGCGAFEESDLDRDGRVTLLDFAWLQEAFAAWLGGPDLVVWALSAPASLTRGQPFTMSFELANEGCGLADGALDVVAYFSLDATLDEAVDTYLGHAEVDLGPGLARYEELASTMSLTAPTAPALGTRYLFACADTAAPFCADACDVDPANNCRSRQVQMVDPPLDLAVTQVVPPSSMIGGQGGRPVQITLVNNSSLYRSVQVTATIGPNNASVTAYAPPGSSSWTVLVNVPTVPFACGGSTNLTVSGCVNVADANPQNNCLSVTAGVEPAYWDLRFEILNAPSSARRNTWTSWQVRVTNVGTIASQPRCWRTGICWYNNSCANYNTCAGVLTFQAGSLNPGQSTTRTVNFFVNGGATLGTQYIKAGIDTFNNCQDACTAGNNDCESITINP